MDINHISEKFGLSAIVSEREITDGHINLTRLIECEDGQRYVFQLMNRSIFPDPRAVMGNISAVSQRIASFEDSPIAVPQYLCTADGESFFETDEGEFFRIHRYIEPTAHTADRVYSAARAFGAFIRITDCKKLKPAETIEGFHSFPRYFAAMTAAEKASPLKKLDRTVMHRLSSLMETLSQVFTVDFPKRNIHGDAKLGNVILSEPPTVIDLDTVMRGYAAIDFGDLVRSACSAGRLDYTVLRNITRGFADGVGNCLSDDEVCSLYYGILYVTGELAVRYLTDYLSDEKYFRGRTSAQCLSRAVGLLDQLGLFINEGDEMTALIYNIFRK